MFLPCFYLQLLHEIVPSYSHPRTQSVQITWWPALEKIEEVLGPVRTSGGAGHQQENCYDSLDVK